MIDFKTAVEQERDNNFLSQYYANPRSPSPNSRERLSEVQLLLKKYTHEEALCFAAASAIWKNGGPDVHDVPVRAYYRVIEENAGKFILEACHVNVHGAHRGDLRFIEVNRRTYVRAHVGCHVTLFPGDVVAVTELTMLRGFEDIPVSKYSYNPTCYWMASEVKILPRRIEKVTFTPLSNGTAVVKDKTEVVNVRTTTEAPLEIGKLYEGTCFVPEKIKRNFTLDHPKKLKNNIIKQCSKIHSSPNALGMVFEYKDAPELTEMFQIGWDACRAGCQSDSSEVIELCVLMGYSAAVSISNGRNDSRSLPMQDIEWKGNLLEFTIENPEANPTVGKWMIKTKIVIRGDENDSFATIESLIPLGPRRLQIVARLSRDVERSQQFTQESHVVCQQENFEIGGLKTGFLELKLRKGSNGRRILEALYGGQKITYEVPKTINQRWFHGVQGSIKLNAFQCIYVDMVMAGIPMVVGCSPFGCGKSMTIVTAAHDIHRQNPSQKQLLITQSNYASVNLVDIASKLDSISKFKFVRYLSEKSFLEFPDECITEYDVQNLMKTVFSAWAKGEITLRKPMNPEKVLNFVLYKKLVEPENLSGQAREIYDPERTPTKPFIRELFESFFPMYNPDVIMTTADALTSLLNLKLLKPRQVSTIQIDEASQLAEHTLVRLLTQFPDANYGLIGDIQQLPPYCEIGLDGKLKDYGIGYTMERAVQEKLFPQAMLREVYRCHPKVTNLLSEMFYGDKLVSGITERERSQFMRCRPDFWPQSHYPVLIVNNEDRGTRMGTSFGNQTEVQIVKNLLKVLTQEHNGYQLRPSKIGVISFYAAQTSVLTEALRGQRVKCGTVDAFQGTERDVIILCCTNEKISEFMQLSNRINVAMSRAKQVTIIVGNVEGLKTAKYWDTIVREADKNGCVLESVSLQSACLENQVWDSSMEGNKYAEQQLRDEMERFGITTRHPPFQSLLLNFALSNGHTSSFKLPRL